MKKEKFLFFNRILIFMIIIFNLFIKLFIDLGIFPYSVSYLSDIMIFILICNSIYYIVYLFRKKQLNKYLLIVLIFIGVSIFVSMISAIIGKTPILLFLWHIRNNYRVFAMLIGCWLFLDTTMIKKMMKYSYILLGIHALLSSYQLIKMFIDNGNFFYQDYINGLFGNVKGYNTYSIILILSISVYYILQFHNEKITKGKLAFVLLLSGWIAAIAELKIFYLYILLLIFLIIITSFKKIKFSRTAILCFCVAVSTIFSLLTMQFFYPQFKNFFINADELKKYVFDVSYGADEEAKININEELSENSFDNSNNSSQSAIPVVNRFSSLKIIPEYFFTENINYIFGIGAGNAEYSQNKLLCSKFYNIHGGINYNRFSLSMLLLENGYMGLMTYVAVFCVIGWLFIRELYYTRKSKQYSVFTIFSLFFAIISVVTIIYDSSFRTEASYFYGFLLSFGLIELTKGEVTKC